jgi:GTP cyclohydrolase IIa
MSALLKRNALVFYTGGDNFMAPSNGLDTNDLSTVFSEVKKELGVGLKAGVGGASNADAAARLATEGLHEIRKRQAKSPIVFKS